MDNQTVEQDPRAIREPVAEVGKPVGVFMSAYLEGLLSNPFFNLSLPTGQTKE